MVEKELSKKTTQNERISRKKAIRLKCLDCCCYQTGEVRKCETRDCPLWHYRLGREV